MTHATTNTDVLVKRGNKILKAQEDLHTAFEFGDDDRISECSKVVRELKTRHYLLLPATKVCMPDP